MNKEIGFSQKEKRQLELFCFDNPRYTRGFPYLDILPRCFENAGFKNMEKQKIIDREVNIRGQIINCRIRPAPVDQIDKTLKYSFPGRVEDEVYRALRFLFVQKHRSNLTTHKNEGRQLQLEFTVYELKKHLHSKGLKFDSRMIDEALKILRGTLFILGGEGEKRKAGREFYLLNDYKFVNDGEDEHKHRRSVMFSSLEYEAFEQGNYIALSYERSSKLRTANAKKLLDLIYFRCRNAVKEEKRKPGDDSPDLVIDLETILQIGTLQVRQKIRDTIYSIDANFKELEDAGSVRKIHYSPFYQAAARRPKLVSAKWEIWLSDEQIEEIIQSLSEEKERREIGVTPEKVHAKLK